MSQSYSIHLKACVLFTNPKLSVNKSIKKLYLKFSRNYLKNTSIIAIPDCRKLKK